MNIKKFTQKDRYGNSMSFEFDVPPMQEVPQGGGQHPGMPVGTDTVPAWLTPGEFVMNAEATRKFKPQLEAMNNQGRAVQRQQGGSIPSPAPVYKNQGGQVPGYQGNGMVGMAGGLMAMDPMMGMSMPNNNSAMDTMVQPQMMPQRQPMPNQMAPIAQGYAPLYRQGGGYIDPRAQQIDDETAMFLKQMEELRQQQNKPSIMQGFIPGNEQVPAGKMIGSKGVQPVIPMDVPPTVQLPTPMEVRQAVPGQETVMPIRTQGGQPIDARGKVYSGRGQSPGARPTPPQPQGIPQVNAGSPTYIDKMTQVESGGKADAKNPNSSATGLHQFTDDTWISVVKKYEPELAKGLSKEEILALRTKPEISTRMAGYLTKENQDALAKEGLPTDDGALYLMHFAGSPRARSILKADPSTPVSEILPEHVIKANESILRGKTAGEVVAWARSKMGTTQQVGQGNLTNEELAKHMSNLDNGADANVPQIFNNADAAAGDLKAAMAEGKDIYQEAGAGVPPEPVGLDTPPVGVGAINSDTRALEEEIKGLEKQLFDQKLADPNSSFVKELESRIEEKKRQIGSNKQGIEDRMVFDREQDRREAEKELAELEQAKRELEKAGVDTTDIDKEISDRKGEIGTRGGRGDKGMATYNKDREEYLKSIVDETEKGLSEEELNLAISEDEALRAGEIEIAKRTDKGQVAMNGIKNFLKEWGLMDLFDKKEIGRMAALYLGSRALGHSHGGSLNWVAKQYLTRVDAKVAAHDKLVDKLTAEGKHDPRSIAKFKESKDINDLVPSPKKLIPTGKTPFILVDGKRVKVQEVKDEDGGVYYRDANNQILNTMSPRVSEYQAEWDKKDTTGAYIRRSEESKKKAAEIFNEIYNFSPADGSGPMGYQDLGDKGNRSYVNFTPKEAAGDFVTWAESQVPPLDSRRPEVQAMMGNAYREALAQGRKGKPTKSLIPFLEGQKIREETGTQELFMTNHEEWIEKDKAITPHYIDTSKMTALRSNVAALARYKYGSDSPANVKAIFDYAMKKWTEMDKGPFDSPPEGETPFYVMLQKQLDEEFSKETFWDSLNKK